MPESIERAYGFHRAGDLARAERLYRELVVAEPANVQALHLLGTLLHQRGDHDAALDLLDAAIRADGGHAASYDNRGSALAALERFSEARAAFLEAEALAGRDPDRSFNIAVVLERSGEIEAANERYREAIGMRPEDPVFRANRAALLRRTGRMEEATAELEQAVRQAPGHAGYRLALAELAMEAGSFGDAAAHARAAVGVEPGSVPALALVGRAERALGRLDKAADAFAAAWSKDRSRDDLLRAFAASAATVATPGYRRAWTECLIVSLVTPGLSAQSLAFAAAVQVSARYSLDLDGERLERQLDGVVRALSDDALFIGLLEHTYNVHASLERALIALRRRLLHVAEPSEAHVRLAFALAQQCFNNEFIWDVSAVEAECVTRLRATCAGHAAAPAASAPDSFTVAMLAAYEPLRSQAFAGSLRALASSTADQGLQTLVTRTIDEPETERDLAASLESLEGDRDEVSAAVRAQYEENPYPRWHALPELTRRTYADALRRRFAGYRPAPRLEGSVRLLCAGCGTGQELLLAATSRHVASVTGVDLSAASLGYTARKAREREVSPLRLVRGDIRAVVALGEDFDVIETTGVLHHLRDPMEGWRALASVLAPGGVMKVGLYSALARRGLDAGTGAIAALELPPTLDGIRRLRELAREAGPADGLSSLFDSEDFYTASACRDLLFHVQEHRFTIPDIRVALDALGLSFIGFEAGAPERDRAYRRFAPDDVAANDLGSWHRFEQENPDAFAGMYVFWCAMPERAGADP